MRRGLYAIADHALCERAGLVLDRVARALIEARPAALQVRWKGAPAGALLALIEALMPEAEAAGVLLVVNDRADVAALAGAPAVHLGQDDLPLARARDLLGARAILGRSTHSPSEVAAALDEGATYLGFGPVFPTSTKMRPDPVVGLEGVAEAARLAADTPVVAIGGIGAGTIAAVARQGAWAAALASGLVREGERAAAITERARRLHAAFLEAAGA